MRLENQHNHGINGLHFNIDQVDFDARAREKRGVTICRVAGTGPCTENSECCSKVCVNHVCCLHSETCKMKDECRTKVPEVSTDCTDVAIMRK